ncbi:MAG TPA: hypothetical protein VFA46_09825 [Actinomycetes bacterium]|jgi:hypothetical protein|nr:hypothetical protein [Actinomycetes bacterium]
MRQRDVRRVLVVEGSKPVGILALGDLAVDRDPSSVLGDISASPPAAAFPGIWDIRTWEQAGVVATVQVTQPVRQGSGGIWVITRVDRNA